MQKANPKPYEIAPKPPIWNNEKFRIALFSGIASIVVIIVSLEMGAINESDTIRDVGIIFGILLGVIPITINQLKESARKDSIDRNMPAFLLNLLSAVQSGSNLVRAIELTADRNLGALTPELKNLRAAISWGMSWDDALEQFAERTGTRVARRVVVLLQMALKIGGDVTDNLEMIQKHVSELQNIEKSRRSALQPYTYTIYISFAVFIAISVLLTTSFFTEIEKVQEGLIEGGNTQGGLFQSLSNMDIEQMEAALFNMAIIEAVFGGLAAGKIGAGSYVAGVKHVVIMIVLAIIAFNVVQI